MIFKCVSDTSISISLFRYYCRWYEGLEQKISSLFHNSQTHELLNKFWQKIKICFRYSFLGRITEREQISPVVLDDSRMVQYLISFYKRSKNKVTDYLRTSLTIGLTKDTKEQLNSSPLQLISIILLTAIVVNVALSIMLQKQIELWGCLVRGLFLLAAAVGLFCKVDWSTVKESSIFLRKM